VVGLLMLFVIYNNERFIVDHFAAAVAWQLRSRRDYLNRLDTRTAGRDFAAS
jgi:hypothetical protein